MTEERKGHFWETVAGKLPPPPGSALLGWKPIEATDGHFKASFEAGEKLLNGVGRVQGGYIAAMLDDVMSPAGQTLLAEGEFIATVEMKVNLLRSASPGQIIGEGRVVRKGRTVVFIEGTLKSADGSLIATGTETAVIAARPEGPADRIG